MDGTNTRCLVASIRSSTKTFDFIIKYVSLCEMLVFAACMLCVDCFSSHVQLLSFNRYLLYFCYFFTPHERKKILNSLYTTYSTFIPLVPL